MTPRTQKILTTVATVAMLLALLWAQQQGYLGTQEQAGGGSARAPAGPRDPSPPQPPPSARRAGYAPHGPAPSQALPGGSLQAHEGRGGHTLERHVGRTTEQLRERLAQEQKREVSTFPDLATAERAVAQALFERRREVNDWLAEGALGDTAITWRSEQVLGRVLREGAREPVPGRTVQVVLYGSTRFPEGFAIRTAYVRLP